MPGRLLVILLLLIGGSITLYVLFKAALAVLQPVIQKKLEQEMQKEKLQHLQNNLELHHQVDQEQVKARQQNMKK